MLTNEEHRRLEELSRRMNEPSLTPKESAELGNLMALDMGASRGPYQPPELRPTRRKRSRAPQSWAQAEMTRPSSG